MELNLTLTFALLAVGVQFVADIASALVAAESVDARVATAVLYGRTLVKFLHKRSGEACFLHCAVRFEDYQQLVRGGPEIVSLVIM